MADFVTAYTALARDLGLAERERRQYLHNLFRNAALRFYMAEVDQLYCSFAEAIRAMRDHFNSASKQLCVKADLSALKFDRFVEQCNGNKREALSSLANHIKANVPLCPPIWRNESHNVDFFRSALLAEY